MFAAVVVLTNSLGNLAIAWGMRHLGTPIDSPLSAISAIFTPWVAVGIILLITWLLSRIAFLSFADLSFVLPVTSLGYVLSALLGHFFLGEHISSWRWTGTFLIVAGTVLAGASDKKESA